MSAHAHVVAGPQNRPKPDIKRFSSRKIDIPATRDPLEMKLLDWIQQILDYIGQNAPIDGVHPATYLIANADGIDMLMYAPTSMQVGPRTVYADFVWGRRPDGRWFIRHVKFGLHLSQAQVKEAERRALKDRLLDKAETENASHFHARQTVFPAEQYIHTWHDEIAHGNVHIKALVGDIYEQAKAEASIPENWVKPEDMALSFAGDGVSALGKMAKGGEIVKEAEGVEHLAEVHEKVDQGKRVIDGYKTLKEYKELDKEEEADEKPIFKKSKADIYADLGVELVSQIPGAGGFVKMIAGMFVDIGLANYAGIVAGIRARIYSCFVGGFVSGITLVGDNPNFKRKRDKKYYELGLSQGLKLAPRISFQYQMALMYYAMTHYTSGFWAGTTFQYHGVHASDWDYPDDWEAKWSPQLLAQSFVTILGFKHYLIG